MFDGRICGDAEKKKCSAKHGKYLDWECTKCRDKEDHLDADEISPLTHHLLWLRRILKGGAPLAVNDLAMETWEQLGMVADIIDSIERHQVAMSGMGKRMGI